MTRSDSGRVVGSGAGRAATAMRAVAPLLLLASCGRLSEEEFLEEYSLRVCERWQVECRDFPNWSDDASDTIDECAVAMFEIISTRLRDFGCEYDPAGAFRPVIGVLGRSFRNCRNAACLIGIEGLQTLPRTISDVNLV